jgi:predicted ABC-type ATPase
MSDKSERDAQRADGDDAMASCMLVDADGNPVFVGDWVKSEKSSDGGDSEGTKSKPQAKSILNASRAMLSATMKSCGANGPGGDGFQPGNTCASGGSGKGGGSSKPKAEADYKPANPDGKDTQARFKDADGNYTAERAKLHDDIVAKSLSSKSPVENPVGYLMGGGPASGKSSVIGKDGVVIPENTVTIDSDEIKKQLPEYQKMVEAKDATAARFVHEESSDVSKQLMRESASGGYNVLLDGTGNGSIDQLSRKVATMKAAGQKVVAHYVTVDTQTAIERSNKRAQRTGRLVPESFVRENHAAVSRVVPEAIERGLFDEFTLWDTNGGGAEAIATARGKEITVLNQTAWDKFIAKGK